MSLWTDYVDFIQAALFCLSAAFGGNMGLAIAILSSLARLALLPLTLRLAYRALEMQQALKRLEPSLLEIRRKHKNDPRRVLEETAKLYRQHDIELVDGRGLLGAAVQAPIFLGLFAAIRRGLSGGTRFLWIKDLAMPDAALALACAIVTAFSAVLGPDVPASQRIATVAVPAVLTFVFLSRVAAGVSIYALASGLVGVLQSILVRRRAAALARA